MARGAWLALLATAFAFGASGASAGPIGPDRRSDASIWAEHGAGRKDGLSLGAYPLPTRAEREDRSATDEMGGEAKERWLRRHYQWLRALGEVLRNSDLVEDNYSAKAPTGPTAPGKETLRLGDVVVLYAAEDAERVTPHLLDDGARYEDPELAGGETLDYLVRDRLIVESAKVAAEYFRPAARGVRSIFGGVTAEPERRRAARYGPAPRRNYELAELENAWFAAPFAETPAQQRQPPERVSMIEFFRGIASDILSAPTTYLLTLLALLGWLILRATVFSRG